MLSLSVLNAKLRTWQKQYWEPEFGDLVMSEERPEEFEGGQPGDDDDWEDRVLCSDGNCIGVIGSDGRCKECGKPHKDERPVPTRQTPQQQDTRQPSQHTEETLAQEESLTEAADEAGGSDWENRVLCSDGNCIGVIGPNGHCKECGKPYEKDADE